MTGPRRLLDEVIPWFQKAFAKYDEDISWDISMMSLPDPSRSGNFVTAMAIYAQAPSPLLNQHIALTSLAQPPGFTEEMAGDLVAELVEQIRQARAYLLNQPNGEQQPGLVLPGG